MEEAIVMAASIFVVAGFTAVLALKWNYYNKETRKER